MEFRLYGRTLSRTPRPCPPSTVRTIADAGNCPLRGTTNRWKHACQESKMVKPNLVPQITIEVATEISFESRAIGRASPNIAENITVSAPSCRATQASNELGCRNTQIPTNKHLYLRAAMRFCPPAASRNILCRKTWRVSNFIHIVVFLLHDHILQWGASRVAPGVWPQLQRLHREITQPRVQQTTVLQRAVNI